MIFANMINLDTSDKVSIGDLMGFNAAKRISRIAYIPITDEYKNISKENISPVVNEVSFNNDVSFNSNNDNTIDNNIDNNVDQIIDELKNKNLNSKEIQKILEFALTRFRGGF